MVGLVGSIGDQVLPGSATGSGSAARKESSSPVPVIASGTGQSTAPMPQCAAAVAAVQSLAEGEARSPRNTTGVLSAAATSGFTSAAIACACA